MAKNEKLIGIFKTKYDKNSIESVVLQCFLRVLKNNNSYMLYRRCVNNTGIMKCLIKKQNRSSDNPFSSASSSGEVIHTLQRITNDMAKSNGKKGGSKDLDKYEVVTMAINHLLHFFMETNGVSMQRLCELGEEIYGMSCYKLFGDSMEDLEKQSEDELNSMTNLDQIKAKLFQDFIVDLQQGKISSSTNFDDYVKSKIDNKKLKEFSEVMPDMSEHVGHMLGRGPEGDMMMENRPGWLDNTPDYYDEGDEEDEGDEDGLWDDD